MPATAAQVFGPVTVDPGFNSTGEKTLLTMNTTLPAGGKNVIIVFVGANGSALAGGLGTLRIKKGATILYGDLHTFRLNYARSYAYIAVDNNPVGNDSYTVTINITTAAPGTSAVHVQGIVIKTDDAVWAFNTTAVNIAAGSTATVVSSTTTYPANSKVVAIMILDGYRSDGGSGQTYIGAGSVRLKLGTTVLTSSPYGLGSHSADQTGWWILVWGGVVTSAPQTWSIEVYNNSTPAVPYNFFGEIVTFTVSDLAFLDSASVALSTTALTTVGDMTTTLSADVVVLAVASGESTVATSGAGLPAGGIVLQKDNNNTTQVANGVAQYLEHPNRWMRAQMYFLARMDTNTVNPSYQVKMRAGWSGINGQAKILAFSLGVIVTVTVTDSGTGVEEATVTATASTTDSAAGAEVVDMVGSIPVDDAGSGTEVADLSATVFTDDAGTGSEFATAGIFQFVDDIGSGTDAVTMVAKEVLDTGAVVELVDMTKEALDSGTGVETIESPVFQQLSDSGAGVEIPVIAVPQSDVGAGVDVVNMTKEVLDTGAGIDAILFVSREVMDIGTAVELPTAIVSTSVFDSGTGFDAIGITVTIHVFDTGTGVEEATRTLSMFGDVTIDEIEIIGLHSIPYTDFVQDRLPIQVQRNAATDFVYIDSEQIGDVLVEWEDRVADVYRGRRTITVMGLVKVVD